MKYACGECLSKKMKKGDLATKLKWKCGYCGAEFEASRTSFFSAATGAPNATFLRRLGITITSQKQIRSSLRYGILTTQRKRQTFTNLTISSRLAEQSGTTSRDNLMQIKRYSVRFTLYLFSYTQLYHFALVLLRHRLNS